MKKENFEDIISQRKIWLTHAQFKPEQTENSREYASNKQNSVTKEGDNF